MSSCEGRKGTLRFASTDRPEFARASCGWSEGRNDEAQAGEVNQRSFLCETVPKPSARANLLLLRCRFRRRNMSSTGLTITLIMTGLQETVRLTLLKTTCAMFDFADTNRTSSTCHRPGSQYSDQLPCCFPCTCRQKHVQCVEENLAGLHQTRGAQGAARIGYWLSST